MTVLELPDRPRAARVPPDPAESTRSGAVLVLQIFAVALFVFPSDMVIRPIGATGSVASLVALFALLAWSLATALGLHRPREAWHPVRCTLVALWLVSLVSYTLMNRAQRSGIEVLAGDRWLLQLAAMSGVVVVAAEGLQSLEQIKRVLRALVWGGAFCGVVAGMQYWMRVDITPVLRSLPGFSQNADNRAILFRGSVARVTGTAIHPIELGVVAGMLLPLALYLAIHDRGRSRRWIPVAAIMIAIPVSVSRSAVLSVALGVGLFIVLLPVVHRAIAFAAVPLAFLGVFMLTPGIIGNLRSFFLAGSSDRSISTRVGDYSLVERLVHQAPLFGRGGGTYLPANGLEIFDNQYLKTAVELGLVGLFVLAAYLLVPLVAALICRSSSDHPSVRCLAGALAGSALAAAACSAAFDSFSFPMFTGVQALVAGLVGATWRVSHRSRTSRGAH